MAEVMEGVSTAAVHNNSVDWQKRCIALETQLMRFRLQAGNIRHLLAERMQELEQRVIEADQRAENAEKQVHIMEEKLKSAITQPSESENSLYRRYQELISQIQEKDMIIKRLEGQLENQNFIRAQEAKIIEEKAAKIKDWVTFKLREMETENQQLKKANLKQTEQILILQDKLQTLLERPMSPAVDAHLVPSSPLHPPSCPGTPPAQEEGWRLTGSIANCRDSKRKIMEGCDSAFHSASLLPTLQDKGDSHKSSQDGVDTTTSVKESAEGAEPSFGVTHERALGGASDRDHSSDELNSKFRSQRLRSSSSSSCSSSSAYETPGPGGFDTPTPTPTSPPLVSLSPPLVRLPLSCPFPLPLPLGTSMTLPKVRTPLTPRDSIQLVKKHHSQPQPGIERLHQINVSIDIGNCTSPSCHSLVPGTVSTHGLEETDIDEGPPESMEGVVEASEMETQPTDGGLFKGLAKEFEMMDPESLKPPTPPLHRFPSWESRIYAVAKSGMRVSEACLGAKTIGRVSTQTQHSTTGPFTHLIYKNISVPVYSTLKGKATQISSVPLPDDDSGSEDDSSSLASLHTSTLVPDKKGSTPGVSMSSISSESDYAIPPDAYSLESDCSEPEHKVQRTSSYSCESVGPETLEKTGYLLKMGSQVKAWKRRWFILRNGEILYYKSPSDMIRKPQGQMELNSSCHIARGEGAQTFQLITEKKTFYLAADSPNILEDWIKVLQNVLKVQASGPISMDKEAKATVRGWLTKVKHGHSKLVWCALIGKVFYYYRNQDDKETLEKTGYLLKMGSQVKAWKRRWFILRNGEILYYKSPSDMIRKPQGQMELNSSCHIARGEGAQTFQDTWLYHLTVAAGSSASLRVGTEYEQLIGKLLDVDGDPDSALWKREVLCFSKEGLRYPLTTLPSVALQTEALKLFKSCQLFINVLVESPSIDYHTSLAQNALQVCLTHPELQNEIYCQLIKQTNCRTPHNYALTQCWQLLSLCVALFLPQHHFLWYLRQYLQQNADPRTEVGKYAVYCQRSVERTLQNGEREAKPSRMEILSILLRNPYHHSLPFSIPVHFMNNTYEVVGFDGSTTVEEFLNTVNQRAGMRKPQISGFALFTDDPSGKDLDHCLQPSNKICDVISKWEQALKELHPGKYEGTRIVRLTYKSRLCFRAQAKGETERERLLLAYQVNEEVQQGHFPVSKELGLEVAALMAQVDHGDLDRPAISSIGSSQPKTQQVLLQVLERFYPKRYKQECSMEQLRELAERLATKWSVLHACTASECVRIYLTVARKWPLFGAKLFSAKPLPPSSLEQTRVWLAVNEDGLSVLDYTMHPFVTHPYQSVITFGGCKEDFMLVVSQIKDQALGKKTVDKLLFAMAKPKILELTLLMASYINYWTSSLPGAGNQTQGSAVGPHGDRKLWDIDSRHFPSMTYTTKGPTLL
ncbi:pleckstrin homology domain-containing family H member 1-like [Sinocyclocheilus grahami]|uniref:pleckstrin homology domain-containing family H member 1-like n=1 Tax=Sinocyclocheilus grahami TaxID=75366 RepID=UPI0007ACD30A|nr:PREDICTED: pleckstrin homology domain-containing family H member 1-like [Sinocyclocheilus grahami]